MGDGKFIFNVEIENRQKTYKMNNEIPFIKIAGRQPSCVLMLE